MDTVQRRKYKMTFELELIPTLLNNLYIPIVKPNSKPSIVKSKDAKEFIKYVQMKCLQQKVKPILGDVLFCMDILICKRNNYDIDAVLKLLFDSFNGYAYKDDKQIVDLRVRKHYKAEKDALIIKIEEIV